ncbi:MAG: RES domain-containing protein [Gemmatimonadota bacterium]
MITAWRIAKRRHAKNAFDGEGARRYGGRWNSPGRPVVYASETRALATLEILAGLRTPSVIPAYVLIGVEFDQTLVAELDVRRLPERWNASPPGDATQSIGDRWFDSSASVVLRVPSVVVPSEFNYLINPLHSAFGAVSVGRPEALHLDPRILP